VWPCWPCAEVYFDRWDKYGLEDRDMWVNDRYTEIRNNVFMAYYRDTNWNLSQLAQHNVDTWMWFERLCMLIQWTDTIFETDVFLPLIRYIEKITNSTYDNNHISYRIIVDHLRASIFLLADWVKPSNEWRWYILRRLIRRSTYHLSLLKEWITQDEVRWIFVAFVEHYVWRYPHLAQAEFNQYYHEANRFVVTLWNGRLLLDQEIKESIKNWNWELAGDVIFKLYDTYGFPVELTREICTVQSINVDRKWYEEAITRAKSLSRSNQAFQKTIDRSSYLIWLPETKFVWYDLKYDLKPLILKEFIYEWWTVFVFDQTVFYPEMWWQLWDYGTMTLDDWRVYDVYMTQKYAWVVLHFAKET
jgi:alanyl-tRNA synthetase